MKKTMFAVTAFITMTVLVFTTCVNTEAKVRMSKKRLTMEVSKTYTLKVKGVKGKIIWKSSKPGVARVNKKGKVTALRKGKATITAKAGKRTYTCVVTVQDKKSKGGVNMATPKPYEPAAVQDNPAATAGQPTSVPDPSTAKPLQPTPTPDVPMPTPPEQTPEQTPEPTPGNSDSDEKWCGPTVLEYAAYMDCRISDIGNGYIEISDADGGVICGFVQLPSFSSPSDDQKYCFDPSELEVVYDGIITDGNTGIPLNGEDKVGGYAITGYKIDYSDLRIGDVVDVVYCYSLGQVNEEDRRYFCCGINVHKR